MAFFLLTAYVRMSTRKDVQQKKMGDQTTEVLNVQGVKTSKASIVVVSYIGVPNVGRIKASRDKISGDRTSGIHTSSRDHTSGVKRHRTAYSALEVKHHKTLILKLI